MPVDPSRRRTMIAARARTSLSIVPDRRALLLSTRALFRHSFRVRARARAASQLRRQGTGRVAVTMGREIQVRIECSADTCLFDFFRGCSGRALHLTLCILFAGATSKILLVTKDIQVHVVPGPCAKSVLQAHKALKILLEPRYLNSYTNSYMKKSYEFIVYMISYEFIISYV